jgi:hypothetical protein
MKSRSSTLRSTRRAAPSRTVRTIERIVHTNDSSGVLHLLCQNDAAVSIECTGSREKQCAARATLARVGCLFPAA